MQNFSEGKIPVGDNKVSSLRKYAFTALQSIYDSSELVNIIDWILEHFTGMTRTQLLNEPDALINQSALIHFSNAVDQLKKGIPVQYVIGEVEFYGLKLYVNASVLIPRPETEELVDIIIKENQSLQGLKILDIGTGSGCIALSLAKHLPSAKVIAIDLSAGALEVAEKNARVNQITNVEFLELDVFKSNHFIEKEFDLIVSNPPYIAASERSTLSPNVLEHEPSMALFVPDSNPLVFYERIAQLAEIHLKKHGKIYVEINERLGTETSKIFHPDSFSSIHLLNDLFGKNRFIKVEKL
jgi:release factor glutamine methyltransferase